MTRSVWCRARAKMRYTLSLSRALWLCGDRRASALCGVGAVVRTKKNMRRPFRMRRRRRRVCKNVQCANTARRAFGAEKRAHSRTKNHASVRMGMEHRIIVCKGMRWMVDLLGWVFISFALRIPLNGEIQSARRLLFAPEKSKYLSTRKYAEMILKSDVKCAGKH